MEEKFEEIEFGDRVLNKLIFLFFLRIACEEYRFDHFAKLRIYFCAERIAGSFGDMGHVFMPLFIYFDTMMKDGHSAALGGGSRIVFMNIQLRHRFYDMVSVENLVEAWGEFVRGKRGRRDVQEFGMHLMDTIFALHADLIHHTYRHGGYQAFNISDPKPRNIHKASVRDRLVHHALYRILYPFFERTFVADSYSCRLEKGTHKALDRFRAFSYNVSKNHTRTVWILKCDIRKFFASIDQTILMDILRIYIPDDEILWLLQEIIGSFSSTVPGVGLPLGNLTSQLLVNVYMNQFDQFMKHRLGVGYYVRYADDFVILSHDREWLYRLISQVDIFLRDRLRLTLHPDKVFIKTLSSGVDFLGWVHFPDHRVLRTATKWRMMKRLALYPTPESFASYRGLLQHGDTYKIQRAILGV